MKLSYPRDLELFMLLWRFKVATTHSIWAALFHEVSIKTCYERLMKLMNSNFIKRIAISESHFVWSLGANGFLAIRNLLPEMKTPGYGSEFPIHDLLVSLASHGDHWASLPNDLTFLTEEELKRLSIEHLPEWYPMDLLRRPDGFWCYQNGEDRGIVALEVETTLKPNAKYETIARHYEMVPDLKRVLWFVTSSKMASAIFECFQNKVGSENFKHDFILISDLVFNGWSASVILGPDEQSSVENVLINRSGSPSVPGRRLSHLDLSVSPHKSRASKQIFNSEFPNLAPPMSALSLSPFIKNSPFAHLIKQH